MNIPININELEILRNTLYTHAKALNSVWNDRQYDYFLQNYVQPVTNDIQVAIDRLNDSIFALRIAVDELEYLAAEY